jgi:hypothetical protein
MYYGTVTMCEKLCTFTVVAVQCPSHSYVHLLWWQCSVHHTVMYIYCGGSAVSITQLCRVDYHSTNPSVFAMSYIVPIF